MKKTILKSVLYALIVFSFSACEQETVEREKEVIRVEDAGIKINKEQKIVDLDNTDISEITAVDSIDFQDMKFPSGRIHSRGIRPVENQTNRLSSVIFW